MDCGGPIVAEAGWADSRTADCNLLGEVGEVKCFETSLLLWRRCVLWEECS